jgi:hypothetical protein
MSQAAPHEPRRILLLASCALVKVCDLFVGNDSALLHVAAAVGTPYVGIFGPTAVSSFQPIPRRPGQGVLVLPPIACPEPVYFVGGRLIWDGPRCAGACAALRHTDVDAVLRGATRVLSEQPAGVTNIRGPAHDPVAASPQGRHTFPTRRHPPAGG